MNETPITAEDLTLYALQSLDSAEAGRTDLLLRSSTAAREELTQIRGDLAALALSAPQHTPPALSRQRLLKQVAREPRALPISVALEEEPHFAVDVRPVVDPAASSGVWAKPTLSAAERRARVQLRRVVADPEPIYAPEETAFAVDANDARQQENVAFHADTDAEFRPHPAQHGEAGFVRAMSSAADNGEHILSKDDLPSKERPSHNAAAGTLWQMPERIETPGPMETQDRYTPRSSPVYSIDEAPRRSQRAAVLAWTGWVAAAGLAAATAFAVRNTSTLQERLRVQQAVLTATQAKTAKADLVQQTLESAASQRFVLARQDTAPMPSARVAYLPEHGSLVFQGTNLEPLPAAKTYELWLIPTNERLQPVPAGTFKPDARGYATLVMPTLTKGTVAGNFGVTIEDEGGSTSPTLPILLIGQQS